ncbi:MAG: sulfate reduction electron transfer complex DsrMKJOP subunit DsrM [Candidatus Nealsonbacteria bacterium]|nr:sulfate reduction electron transfer complex DsrMKJOP subunit DsrM [Candidatus Nealsonbacteria bacterium]
MKIIVSLAAVAGLFLLGYLGAATKMTWVLLVFGVAVPYVAVVMLLGGLTYRVMSWAASSVPFRIPTTCGQQKSLGWIKQEKLENPHNTLTVIGRMALEVLLFRSLMRNTKTRLTADKNLVYATDLSLWAGAMAMHWALLLILIRHLRLMTNPVPICVTFLEAADGFLEVGLPVIYVTSVLFLAGLAYLLVRRLTNPQVRYISLPGDYFPLFLLLGIGISGFCLRHFFKTDVVAIKEMTLGLVSFAPTVPDGISPLFFGHLLLVCALLAYIPLSKLTHLAGVFLSPTRNMANSNRRVRHVNPWDYPVKVHPYDEYEDELRDKMKAAGLPVEKE